MPFCPTFSPGSRPYWLLRSDWECTGCWYFPWRRLGTASAGSDPRILQGPGRWLPALSAGGVLQVFHKAGGWGLRPGEESDPLTLPHPPIQEPGGIEPYLCFSHGALLHCRMQLSLLETCRIWEGRKELGIMGFCSSSASGERAQLRPGTQESTCICWQSEFPVLEAEWCHGKSSGLGHWGTDLSLPPPCSVALTGACLLCSSVSRIKNKRIGSRCSLASSSFTIYQRYTHYSSRLSMWLPGKAPCLFLFLPPHTLRLLMVIFSRPLHKVQKYRIVVRVKSHSYLWQYQSFIKH